MSGEDEDLEKSRGLCVSNSLVKTQEIKRYQPQSGTSHVKLNKASLCFAWLRQTSCGRSRGELLLKWWCCGQFGAGNFSLCMSTESVCVCIFLHVCFFLYFSRERACTSAEAQHAPKLLKAHSRCLLLLEQYFKA